MYDPRISALALQDPEAAAIERRRMLAAMLMQQGQQNQRMTHPLQVVGNLANTAVSALLMRKADEEGKALADQQRSEVRSFFAPPRPAEGASTDAAGSFAAPPPSPVQRDPLPPLAGSTLSVPEHLRPVIQQASDQSGVPFNIIAAKLQQESGFRPDARGTSGEVGISQIMPSTGAQPGYGLPPISMADAAEPEKAIPWGAQYLAARAKAQGVNDWNDPAQAAKGLAAYNGSGPAAEGYGRQVAGLAGLGGAQPPQAPASAGSMQAQPQPGSADMPVPGLPGMTLGALTTRVMEGLNSENPRIRAQAEKYVPLLNFFRQQEQPGGTVNINGPQGPGVYERKPNGGLRFLGGIPETALLPEDVEAQRKRLAEAAKPTTTITNDRSFGDRISENAANEVKDARGSARTGADAIRTANRIEQLLNSDVIVGAGADMRLGFERALSTVGLIDGRRVTNTEQLMAELARNVLPLVESLKGPTSDRDIEFLRQAANGQITFSKDTIARASQLARDYGSRSIENYNSLVEPIQSDEKIPPAARNVYRPVGIPTVEPLPPGITNWRAAPSSVPIPGSGASAEPPAAPSRPVAVRTPEEARRLPSGTQILLPDGTLGRVP